MPRNSRRQQTTSPETTTPTTIQKPNPRFLSLLLQAVIMAFILSLFFIFVGVAAIIFIHLCIAGGALHRRNRRRPISPLPVSPSGFSLEDLKSLPKCKYNHLTINSNNGDINVTNNGNNSSFSCCAICLENIVDGDICRVLPGCKHVFHLGCVDKWLVKAPVCPVCRASVRVGFGSDDDKQRRAAGIDWEQLWSSYG